MRLKLQILVAAETDDVPEFAEGNAVAAVTR
jgi:hypothetical protein